MRDSKETLEQFKERLTLARYRLKEKEPFLGFLALELPTYVTTDDAHIPTAATDYAAYYFNYNWAKQLTDHELVFVVNHEIAHVILRHDMRRDNRDPELWNVAGDYVINGMIIESTGQGKPLQALAAMPAKVDGGRVEKIGLHDPKFDGLTSEQVYEKLLRQIQTPQRQRAGDKPGADARDGARNWDIHLPRRTDESGPKEAIGRALARARDWREKRGFGDKPGSWERHAEEGLEPYAPWTQLLRRNIMVSGTEGISWQRPNRRWLPYGLYAPSHVAFRCKKITVVFDTSGSISDQFLGYALEELQAILSMNITESMTLLCCDAQVHPVGEFTAHRPIDVEAAKLKGGGGTDFRPAFDAASKNGSGILVYLTDTIGTFPEKAPIGIETIWLVPDQIASKVPFGRLVRVPLPIRS